MHVFNVIFNCYDDETKELISTEFLACFAGKDDATAFVQTQLGCLKDSAPVLSEEVKDVPDECGQVAKTVYSVTANDDGIDTIFEYVIIRSKIM